MTSLERRSIASSRDDVTNYDELLKELADAGEFIGHHEMQEEREGPIEERDLVGLLHGENEGKKGASSTSLSAERVTSNRESVELLRRKICESPEFASGSERGFRTGCKFTSARSTSNASLKSLGEESAQYPNPFLEDEFEETSPFLGNSKSSLWTVSTGRSSASSFVDNHQKYHSRNMSVSGDRKSETASREDLSRNPATMAPGPSSSDEFVMISGKNNGESNNGHESKVSPSKVTTQEEIPTKKKKKTPKGLPLPVKTFKARPERDPEMINQDLRVTFGDVIAEPAGYHAPKWTWNLSKEVYAFVTGGCYTLVSLFCGVPIAFLWGIWFATLACINVWCLVPLRRSHNIKMSWWKGFWGVFVSSICDPISQSAGMIFSNMSVRTEKHIV